MVVIIGAGISGLTAAKNLNKPFIILEKTERWGGLSTQYPSGGHWFDYGGHYFHFKNHPGIKTYLEKFGNFVRFNRNSKTFLFDTTIPFPIQYHLSYLPRPVGRKILTQIPDHPDFDRDNLQDYLKFNLGDELFSIFFEPFLKKYLKNDLKNLMARMDRGSIPVPDKEAMKQGFRGKRFAGAGYNPHFYYPAAPLRHFMDNMAEKLRPAIHFNQTVKEINLKSRQITTDTSQFHFDLIINSMPLKHLLEITDPPVAFPGRGELAHISTLVVNVVLKKRRRRFHWVYLPETDLPFYRAGYYPLRRPPVCYLERSLPPSRLPETGGQLREEVIHTLKRLRMITDRREIIFMDHRIIPVSYVIFNHHWPNTVPQLLEKLEALGIYSVGRYGTWNYSSMSDDVVLAKKTAQKINRK